MDITIIIAKIKEIMEEWFALKENVPTKTSDLINDNDFITMQNVKPTKLKNGDNIDNLLTQGCYWINSNPDAENISGTFPINGHYAYVILVDGSEKVIRQIATVYKGQGTRTFVRMYSGYTSNYGWGEWKEVSFVDHTHANISDTGWQEVIFEDGYTKYGDPVRYRRIGKVVHIEGIIKNTSAFTPSETAQKVATISDIYCRPQYTQYGLMQGTGANKFLLSIQPNGNIGIARYGTTTTSTQIGANSWLHCNLTWMVETENTSVETSITESEDGLNYFLSNNDNGTPYDTFYPYAIQLKNTTNNEGINNKNIQWHIDDTQQTSSVTENNGYAFFRIPYTTWSDKGSHTFAFNFEEDETCRTSSMSITLDYESIAIPTGISRSGMNSSTFSGTLAYRVTNSIIRVLPNRTIKYYVDDVLKSTATTNNNGIFSVSLDNLSEGARIKFVFEEDIPYKESTYSIVYHSDTNF